MLAFHKNVSESLLSINHTNIPHCITETYFADLTMYQFFCKESRDPRATSKREIDNNIFQGQFPVFEPTIHFGQCYKTVLQTIPTLYKLIGIGIGLLKIHIAASKAELHEITI